MLTYTPQKVEITNSDHATETTVNNIESNTGFLSSVLGIVSNQIATTDNKVTSIRDNTSNIEDKLPPLTATPTYFEFTALNVNDSSVSRLVQNSTGSTVYITRICIFYNTASTGVNYNDWLPTTNAIQHVIDVSASNNNYPTDSQRVILEAQTYPELIKRYNVTYEQKTHESLNNAWRNQYFYVTFDRPILLENNNYIRLFKNGDASGLNDYHITAQGYYHVNTDITTPIII